MNLAKMKELEDLKAERGEKGKQYHNMFTAKRENYLRQAAVDFEEFFKEKGFCISRKEYMIEAQYNTMKISMEIAKFDEYYVGALSVFSLIISSHEKKEYSIILNEMGHYPSVKCTISSSTPKQKSEDEKIQDEIKDTLEGIKKVDKDIKEFDKVKLGFGLRDKKEKTFNKYPQFESIKKLLGSLFQ